MTIEETIKELSYDATAYGGKCTSEVRKIAIQALEKQIPKEPKYQGEHEKCPTCGSFYIEDYCAMCGQKIKW